MSSGLTAPLIALLRSLSNSSTMSLPLRIYGVVVGMATIYGGIRGFFNWFRWYISRTPLRIKYKAVEPIVNVAVDGGYMAWHAGGAALCSAVVAATAPISVPLLVHFGNDNNSPTHPTSARS